VIHGQQNSSMKDMSFLGGQLYLHLSIGPSGNFNNHVEDGLLGIGIEWDVVKW
jgi:hypothetical protein